MTWAQPVKIQTEKTMESLGHGGQYLYAPGQVYVGKPPGITKILPPAKELKQDNSIQSMISSRGNCDSCYDVRGIQGVS